MIIIFRKVSSNSGYIKKNFLIKEFSFVFLFKVWIVGFVNDFLILMLIAFCLLHIKNKVIKKLI